MPHKPNQTALTHRVTQTSLPISKSKLTAHLHSPVPLFSLLCDHFPETVHSCSSFHSFSSAHSVPLSCLCIFTYVCRFPLFHHHANSSSPSFSSSMSLDFCNLITSLKASQVFQFQFLSEHVCRYERSFCASPFAIFEHASPVECRILSAVFSALYSCSLTRLVLLFVCR